MALCTPNEQLKELQDTNQLGRLMVMQEAVKMLPIGEVWEEYCRGKVLQMMHISMMQSKNMKKKYW